MPLSPQTAHSREEVYIILLMLNFSGNLDLFVRQLLFPLNQQICKYLNVFKTIILFSFLLAGFERNVLLADTIARQLSFLNYKDLLEWV